MTIINTNIPSLNAQRNLASSQGSLATSMNRLSSGLRVNSAKDDAAGLAIATRMDAQIRGMNVAIRNANDGISLAQTAEGSLARITDSLQRMRELAVQSANGSNSTADRTSLNEEYTLLAAEITRVVDSTKFNGISILKTIDAQDFQVGANGDTADKISIRIPDLSVAGDPLGLVVAATGTPLVLTAGIEDTTKATDALDLLDAGLDAVNSARGTLGAAQNRFEAVIQNLQISVENQSAAKSRIMDADFASETAKLSRAQVLQQAGTAMVAQANQLPQSVLKLLG